MGWTELWLAAYQPEVLKRTLFNAEAWEEIVHDALEDRVVWGMLLFVVMQPILRFIFRDGRGYIAYKRYWKGVMALYNGLMSLYSLATFVLAVLELTKTGVYQYEGGDGTCVGGPYDSAVFTMLSRWFYLSKYVEYLDTVFLIVAQKHVSTLQYFHHLGAAPVMWILHRYRNADGWIFVVFNSFIHTWMYFYFASAALGKAVGAVRPLITFSQLAQFVWGVLLTSLYLHLDCYRSNLKLFIGWYFVTWYTMLLFILFSHFFVQSYILAPKRSGKRKES